MTASTKAKVIGLSAQSGINTGTGDVFSSIIAADAVNGKDLTSAVRHASSFIAKVLRRTVEMGLPDTDGICFEEYLTEIQQEA